MRDINYKRTNEFVLERLLDNIVEWKGRIYRRIGSLLSPLLTRAGYITSIYNIYIYIYIEYITDTAIHDWNLCNTNNKVKMAWKRGENQEENAVGCTGEGSR